MCSQKALYLAAESVLLTSLCKLAVFTALHCTSRQNNISSWHLRGNTAYRTDIAGCAKLSTKYDALGRADSQAWSPDAGGPDSGAAAAPRSARQAQHSAAGMCWIPLCTTRSSQRKRSWCAPTGGTQNKSMQQAPACTLSAFGFQQAAGLSWLSGSRPDGFLLPRLG